MNEYDRRGILLLELLIALAVMGIGCVALMQALSFLVQQDEKVRARSYVMLTADNIAIRYAAGELADTTGEQEWGQKTFSWQLERAPERDGLAPVHITITWMDRNQPRQFSTTRYVLSGSR